MTSERRDVLLLVSILVLAAALRLHRLGHSPPGLHVDEASNVWSSWCLLHTGRDASGARWPVFYTHSFGENRSPLMIYALLPFEAIFGLDVAGVRLAAAVAGTAAVFLAFFVGARLFDRAAGLVCAALLAISPWHLQHSRWAHEATLSPFLVLAALGAWLWARLPISDEAAAERQPLRPFRAAVAGALSGIACYGYQSVRLVLPLLLGAAVAVTWKGWKERLRDRRDRLALATLLVTFACTFLPLVFKHLTDPAIGKRGATTWVWDAGDPPVTRLGKVLARYPGHFGADFLFERGDPRIDLSPPPGYGLFNWYVLPLLVAGVVVLVSRARTSRSARVALVFLALYPAADLLNRHETMNVLRSLAGLPAIALAAAVGGVAMFRFLAGRWRRIALAAAGTFALVAAVSAVRFLAVFFGSYDRQWDKYFAFQRDLIEAVDWLRPRLESADAVVVTGVEMTHPYIYTLVGLRYDPARWLADEKSIVAGPLADGTYAFEDVVSRYGKVWFLLPGLPVPLPIQRLARGERSGRLVLIVRPGELGLDRARKPDLQVRSPRDETVLEAFDIMPP